MKRWLAQPSNTSTPSFAIATCQVAVPRPRHRMWAVAAGVPVMLMLAALLVVPAAGANALQRWLMPWSNVDRYTFAQVSGLPDSIVVPHGEEFEFSAQLSNQTKWSPDNGSVHFNDQTPVTSDIQDKTYSFTIPPQTETGTLNVRIGDIREAIDVQVAARPELSSLTASIVLPDYLQYSRDLTTDVRGGVISVLKGSVAKFAAEVSRHLEAASVQGQPANVVENRVLPDADDC